MLFMLWWPSAGGPVCWCSRAHIARRKPGSLEDALFSGKRMDPALTQQRLRFRPRTCDGAQVEIAVLRREVERFLELLGAPGAGAGTSTRRDSGGEHAPEVLGAVGRSRRWRGCLVIRRERHVVGVRGEFLGAYLGGLLVSGDAVLPGGIHAERQSCEAGRPDGLAQGRGVGGRWHADGD